MRVATVQIALAVALSLSCADEPWPRPASIPTAQFVTEFNEWREYRRSRMVVPGSGAVTWIGLWALDEGVAEMGADSTLQIVLPRANSPSRAGALHRAGAAVRFDPAPGATIRVADSIPVTAPLALVSDRQRGATVLSLGTLRFRIHGEPGTDRLWLRGWDVEHPSRATFQLPESYQPDTSWRVSARFEPFRSPRAIQVGDVTGGEQAYRSPGELVFRVGERTHRLAAFADSGARNFFVIFWDSTARTNTYQGGRYLSVPIPAEGEEWTVIDFNRAYNPPCVFTPYSVCALPPRGNRLAMPVTAGEKRKAD